MPETIETSPTAGEKYVVNCRFGKATVKVHSIEADWAVCEILSGTLRGSGRGAVWSRGAMKSLRIFGATWTPIKNSN